MSEPKRRDFLIYLAGAMGVFAAGSSAWILVDTMNPAADTLASTVVDVDLTLIKPGQRTTIFWRRWPFFIYHRTVDDIKEARSEDWPKLRDPQSDESRVKNGYDKWLVVGAQCTRGDCFLRDAKLGNSTYSNAWGGWFCPCCNSGYDKSGRVHSGPAPKNMVVPHYEFITDNLIRFDKYPPF